MTSHGEPRAAVELTLNGEPARLEAAVRWTLASCRGYRIPEPTRQAHLHVNQLRLRDAL